MSKTATNAEFKGTFIARVRWARIGRGYNQAEAAELLGIEQGKYQKYETRPYLPHYLILRFCLACGVDPAWLFSGKGRGPASPAPAPHRARRLRRKK